MAKHHKPNQEYELPATIRKCQKRILGLDPGSRNFGISVVGYADGKVRVLANSVMTNPVNDLINYPVSKELFLAEIDRWMQWANPDGIIIERFQTRGNGGPLIEFVSVMIGLLGGRYGTMPIKATVASAWKNRVTKRFGVKLKDDTYPNIDVQPHQLDASLIGIYGLEQGLNMDIDYNLDRVIEQCETTSLIGLRRRVQRRN